MACCCNYFDPTSQHSKFKATLWIALFLNFSMFIIEIFGGIYANSSSLWADALDFMGDSINYIISLFVLSATLYYRSWASLLKGATMALFGIAVLIKIGLSLWSGHLPEPLTMGFIGFLALIVNSIALAILYNFHQGDSNMQSVWLCTRNDMIGNCAILFASLGILGTQTLFPDLLVAFIMAGLGITSGVKIIKLALQEQKDFRLTQQPCSCCH